MEQKLGNYNRHPIKIEEWVVYNSHRTKTILSLHACVLCAGDQNQGFGHARQEPQIFTLQI